MKNVAYLCITISILSACSSENLVGEYQASLPTQVDQMFLKASGYDGIAGSIQLELNQDLTFRYETCGIILEGIYITDRGQLKLHPAEMFQRISSAELKAIPFETYPIYHSDLKLQVRGQKLVGTFDGVYYHLMRK